MMSQFAGAAFTPTTISGCILWLRADLGVTLASGKVSAWADQSGNSNNFSQGTAAQQPVFNSSGVNGQPTLSFTAANSTFLLGPTLDATGFTGLTFVVMVNYTSTATFAMFVSQSELDELRAFSDGTSLQMATSFSNNCNGATNRSGVWGMACGRHVSSTNAVDVSWKKVLDASATGGALGASVLAIGARSSGSFYMTGQIAEVAAYNRAITDAERDQLNSYGASRYGYAA